MRRVSILPAWLRRAPKETVRRCVHVGQLHLGHLAKSFGLLEPPSKLSAQQSKKALKMGGGGRSRCLAGAEYLPRGSAPIRATAR